MRKNTRLSLLAASTLAVSAVTGVVSAQTELAEFRWAVAPLGVVADDRVADAIAQLVDEDAVATASGIEGAVLASASAAGAGRDIVLAAQLLQAAGLDVGLIAVRECRTWIAPPAVDGASFDPDQRAGVRAALEAELQSGFSALGLTLELCELVQDPAQADFLLWTSDEPAPVLTDVHDPGIGVISPAVAGEEAQGDAAGQGGPQMGGGPSSLGSPGGLPATGSGGLADGEAGGLSLPLLVASVLAGVAALGAAGARAIRVRR